MYQALEEELDLTVHSKEVLALTHLPQQVGKRRSRQRRANMCCPRRRRSVKKNKAERDGKAGRGVSYILDTVLREAFLIM